jgi:hypothetical protein
MAAPLLATARVLTDIANTAAIGSNVLAGWHWAINALAADEHFDGARPWAPMLGQPSLQSTLLIGVNFASILVARRRYVLSRWAGR